MAELAKLQSDTAAPSSFAEENSKARMGLEAKLQQLHKQARAALAVNTGRWLPRAMSKLGAAPSSFADVDPSDIVELNEVDAFLGNEAKSAQQQLAKMKRDMHHAEEEHPTIEDSSAEYEKEHGLSHGLPSSFVEVGAPDSFADLDAKLKALEEKTKAELAKLQSDTAAPSSFVEESDAENPGSALLHLIHDGGAEHIKERAAEEASHAVQLKEATSQDLAARHMAFIEGLKGIAEPLKSRLGKKIAEEDEERKHTEEELSRMRSEHAADSLASSFLQENDGDGMHGFTGFHGRRYKEQSEEMKDEEGKAEEAEAGVDKIRHKLAEQLKAAQAGVDQFGEELKDADSAPTTSPQLDQLRKELKSRA